MGHVCTADGKNSTTKQLLNFLHQKPLSPTYILSALQVELANFDSIYISYKPLILTGLNF